MKTYLKLKNQSKALIELRDRVRKKNAYLVPRPPKEELKEITEQANKIAEKPSKSSFKRFTVV